MQLPEGREDRYELIAQAIERALSFPGARVRFERSEDSYQKRAVYVRFIAVFPDKSEFWCEVSTKVLDAARDIELIINSIVKQISWKYLNARRVDPVRMPEQSPLEAVKAVRDGKLTPKQATEAWTDAARVLQAQATEDTRETSNAAVEAILALMVKIEAPCVHVDEDRSLGAKILRAKARACFDEYLRKYQVRLAIEGPKP